MDSTIPRRRPRHTGRQRAIIRLAGTLALMLPPGGTDLAAQPVIRDAEIVVWGCLPPGAQRNPDYVPFTGIIAGATPGLAAIRDAFPTEWQGRPRIQVGLKPRPPGLRFRFSAPTNAGAEPWADPPERLLFDPPELVSNPPVRVDSILVDWAPVEGYQITHAAVFDAGCSFLIYTGQTVMVYADATVNVVAVYAAPGDTLEVWGDEVGISDFHIADAQMTGWFPVEPATWGQIKMGRR